MALVKMLDVPQIPLFIYNCRSSKMAGLMLYHHVVVTCTCNGNICASAIYHFYKFKLFDI